MTKLDEEFWALDSDEFRHVHGNHWEVFFEDPVSMLQKLVPVTVEHGALWIDNKDSRTTDVPPAVIIRLGLEGDAGASLALIGIGNDVNELVSMWPMVEDIGTHTLTLRRGFLWANRMEAQLEADLGPSTITFFDHRFLAEGADYRAGMAATFHLCIHAYRLEPADTTPIVITDPKWPAREFIQPDDPDDPNSPITIRTEGMAAFFQSKATDRDDCEFRGPVRAVRELPERAFGKRTWIVTVTVLRDTEDGDEEIDLDIVLTDLRLGDQPLPQVGDDVQGTGWVQGWLAG